MSRFHCDSRKLQEVFKIEYYLNNIFFPFYKNFMLFVMPPERLPLNLAEVVISSDFQKFSQFMILPLRHSSIRIHSTFQMPLTQG